MSRNYKFHNQEGVYFVIFATVFWVDVFVRRICFDSIVENLNICMEKNGMKVFCWCMMSSHIHLIFQSTKQRQEQLHRDFNYTFATSVPLAAAGTIPVRGCDGKFCL
jgi:putative transposase